MDGPALYRSLLKAAKHWPLDTARKNRDLGAHIRHRLPVEFRGLEDVKSAAQVDVLRRAEAELNGLVQLTSNYYKSKVRVRPAPECHGLVICFASRLPRVVRDSVFAASLPIQYKRAADIATTNQPRTLYENVLSNAGQTEIKSGRRPGFFRSLMLRFRA